MAVGCLLPRSLAASKMNLEKRLLLHWVFMVSMQILKENPFPGHTWNGKSLISFSDLTFWNFGPTLNGPWVLGPGWLSLFLTLNMGALYGGARSVAGLVPLWLLQRGDYHRKLPTSGQPCPTS